MINPKVAYLLLPCLCMQLFQPDIADGGSSGHSRAFLAPTPGGAIQVPSSIYFIVDPEAAGGSGHAAIIIPDGDGLTFGCTYYSFDETNRVTTCQFNNIDDALAAARVSNYQREIHWKVSHADAVAAAGRMAYDYTSYVFSTHNCMNMVASGLTAANVEITGWAEQPNDSYKALRELGDGHSQF